MNGRTGIRIGFIGFFITLILTSGVFAGSAEKTQQLVEKGLVHQLSRDLTEKSLDVELKDFDESPVSNEAVRVVGEAFCLLEHDRTKLPIHFEMLVNTSKNKVESIDYEFLREPVIDTLATDEELISRAVTEKIHRDLKTTNVVLTIEGLTKIPESSGSAGYTGFGEVKINDFILKRIRFNVEMDGLNKETKVNSYQIGEY